MKFLADTSLPGLGNISGAFLDNERGLLAAACWFRLLTEPSARASYTGHRPRHRLALYEYGNRLPSAIFDHLRFPINDVAFHPELPIVAIATGTYDGGWMFQGELLLWNWETGQSGLGVESIPEVARVAFDADGSNIIALVRPWDEGMVENISSPLDTFDMFFEVQLPFWPFLNGKASDGGKTAEQLASQAPISGQEIETDKRFVPIFSDFMDVISRHCETGPFLSRSPIWDVAFLKDGQIGMVHDDCHLELLDRTGELTASFDGKGHGCELFGGATESLVHVSAARASENWHDATSSTIFRLRDGALNEDRTFIGSHTFSLSSDGRILARRDKSAVPNKKRIKDHVCQGGVWTRIDLGNYDAFNHYIRIDQSPFLFFIQDEVPDRDPLADFSARSKKWLCMLESDNSVKRLWRLLDDDGTAASEALECSYAFIQNEFSEVIVVAGKHYDPNPSNAFSGFIYGREMWSGKELWRHTTSASPTVLQYVAQSNCVLAFFLDGNQMVIDANSGEIVREKRFAPAGLPLIICACDVMDEEVVVGTIDGRIAIASLREIAS